MDKYFRKFPRVRGGSSLWTEPNAGSTLLNNETFGIVTPPSGLSSFWLKVSGVWKQCITYIKVGGVWKTASPNIKVLGTWRPVLAPVYVPVTFGGTQSNISYNPSDPSGRIYYPTTPSNSVPSEIKTDLSIPSGQDGGVNQTYLDALVTKTYFMTLSTVNTLSSPYSQDVNSGYSFGMGEDDQYYYGFNGSYTGTGYFWTENDIIQLRRTGSDIVAEIYRASSWIILNTWSGASTGQLWYYVCSLNAAPYSVTMLNPNIYNLS